MSVTTFRLKPFLLIYKFTTNSCNKRKRKPFGKKTQTSGQTIQILVYTSAMRMEDRGAQSATTQASPWTGLTCHCTKPAESLHHTSFQNTQEIIQQLHSFPCLGIYFTFCKKFVPCSEPVFSLV